ncbi:MAG TPA: hypothetical protein VGC54_05930 [Planctomycetota bacterium]
MKTLWIALVLAAVVAGFALSRSGGANPGVDGYGTTAAFEGIVQERPYGMLHVPAPDGTLRAFLLVGPGKTGAATAVADQHGAWARVQGTLIERADLAVLEVHAVEPLDRPPLGLPVPVEVESVALRGEIVDTKCALGRMKPGSGVLHRECAIRCIRGGIPPTLMVAAGADVRFYLLADPEGAAANDLVLDFVGDPVEVRGLLHHQGPLPVLHVARAGIRRL